MYVFFAYQSYKYVSKKEVLDAWWNIFLNTAFLSYPYHNIVWTDISNPNAPIHLNLNSRTLSLRNFNNGSYIIKLDVEDDIGCAASDTISLMITSTGISINKYADVLLKYNIDAKEVIVSGLDETELQIIDLSGRLLKKLKINEDKNFYINDLKPGMYLIHAGRYKNKITIQ